MPLRTTPQTSPGAPHNAGGAHDGGLEKRVGRGAALLTAGKLWFILAGYATEFLLPRVFAHHAGEAEGKKLYGAYGLVVGLVAILNAFVYQGIAQAVARFVAKAPDEIAAVRRAAFKLQAVVVGVLFAVQFVFADVVARFLWEDAGLANALRFGSFILLAFGFYAVTMGSLTGRQLFKRQALLDVSYTTLKLACVVGAAWLLGRTLGFVEGALFGFAAASVLVLLASLVLAPREPLRGHLAVMDLFRFQFLTMAFNGLVTMVAKIDQQLLQKLSGDLSLGGEYKAAQLLATVPYQAVFAITFVLFPLVSGAAGRETERMRGYIRETSRYALILASMITLCFASAPERAITLLFKPEYAPAAPMLRVLVLGYLTFSVFYIMTAVLTAAGRPQASLALVAVVLVVQTGLGALLIGRFGGLGVATATACAMSVGLAGAHVWLRRAFGAGLELGMAARVLLAAAVVGMCVHLLLDGTTVLGTPGLLADIGAPASTQRRVTVIVFGVASAAFVALLFVTGGLRKSDTERFVRVFARGKA